MQTAHLRHACHGCEISIRQFRSSCIWCGSAIRQGRTATDRELYETSRMAVDDRLQAIEEARRKPDHVDAMVEKAIHQQLKPLMEFTYDELVHTTGLNPCALKYSLLRLQAKGLVRMVGEVRVRSNRSRPVWQVLLPASAFAEASKPVRNLKQVVESI